MKNFRPWLAGAITVIILFFVGVIILATAIPGQQTASATKPTATSTSTPGTGTPATSCDPMFKQVAGNNASHSVDADFEAKYAEATKDGNLSDAQKTVLLVNSANNAQRLATWAHGYGLYSEPNNWQPLVAEDCLSAEGQKLYYQFEGALNATGTTFAEADAPADGYNSGVDETGVYGVDASQGVRGDRKAIKSTLPDGTTVWIMVRCGNVVYSGPPPGLPTVPTDNPPVETPPEVTPPVEKPPVVVPPVWKDSPNNDPAVKGNAPEGGGTNVDPGPGTYIAPENMEQPPAAPRVNPAPPAPAPAPAPAPVPVGSTPDPAPAPVIEPAAPTPDAPAEGCSPPPGMTTC